MSNSSTDRDRDRVTDELSSSSESFNYDRIDSLIGEKMRNAWRAGELKQVAQGLGRVSDMIVSLQLPPKQQTHFLTKIAKNIIDNVASNMEDNESPFSVIISFLLTVVGSMCEVSDDDTHTSDRFEYDPRGSADVRILATSYLPLLYIIIHRINETLDEIQNGIKTSAEHQQQADNMEKTMHAILEFLGCVTGPNIMGRCIDVRKMTWSYHVTDEDKGDAEFYEQMNALRTMCMSLRWNARFLCHAMNVLDDEILTVIHLQEQWGVRVNIRGISVNDQLVTMLTYLLYHNYTTIMGDATATPTFECPSQEIMDVMTGVGPIQLPREIQYKYEFMMWNWYAPKRTAAGTYECFFLDISTRIWGEGIPADIASCPYLSPDGDIAPAATRLIILDANSRYVRHSNVCRDFGPMQADMTLVNVLSKDEVVGIMTRITGVSAQTRQNAISENQLRTNEQPLR